MADTESQPRCGSHCMLRQGAEAVAPDRSNHASQANESSQANALAKEYGRRLRRRFLQIALAEWTGVVAAILLGIFFHRPDLIWPGASLIVCLHFAPLASLFRVRPYYFLAAAGSVFCVIAPFTPAASMNTAHRLLLVGAGVGSAMWMTAAYNVLAAHRLARKLGP